MQMQHSLTRPADGYRDLWGLVGMVAIAVFLTGLALWMILSQYTVALPRLGLLPEDPLQRQQAFMEETGIRILHVGLLAGGSMLDLSYQVVDPDKAVIVHDDEYPPGFLVEATGQIINTPYHDHADFDAHHAVTYHELIMNPAGVLKPGDKITVLVGQSRLEHIIVQGR